MCYFAGGAVQQSGKQAAREMPCCTERVIIELVVVRADKGLVQSLQLLGEYAAVPGQAFVCGLDMSAERFAQFSGEPGRNSAGTVRCCHHFAQVIPETPQLSSRRCPLGLRAELLIELRRSRHETTSRPYRPLKPHPLFPSA